MKSVTAETDKQRWEREVLEPALKKSPERAVPFTTISGRPIDRLYTADDLAGLRLRARPQPSRRVPLHARHPSRPATAASSGRCGSSPGSARRRRPTSATRRCSQAGGTGLSVAFDLPTLMGRDPDHELSLGEVGKCGVSIVVARRHGAAVRRHRARRHHDVDDDQLAGADDLRDVPGRRREAGRRLEDSCRARSRTTSSRSSSRRRSTSIPPRQSMRLITDIFAFCAKEVPQWNTISVSGYHIREAGSTALQELAFTLRDGIEYVQYGIDAGLDVDDFAPRISFFFNSHSDFFEEIAKFRAARKLWARGDARPLRREGRALVEAALPHADRRRLADRAAAVQQRRAHRAAGAGGGARRHQLAAHQLARRGAGAADRGSGDARAAHAADHRPRERRRPTSSIRSAARTSSSG